MYLIALGWMYVAVMMAVAEATNTNGSILGALITFLLYGVGPAALLMYILGTPARRRKRREQERADAEAPSDPALGEPDTRREPAADPVAPVREKD